MLKSITILYKAYHCYHTHLQVLPLLSQSSKAYHIYHLPARFITVITKFDKSYHLCYQVTATIFYKSYITDNSSQVFSHLSKSVQVEPVFQTITWLNQLIKRTATNSVTPEDANRTSGSNRGNYMYIILCIIYTVLVIRTMKNPISKIAWGCGKLYFCRLSYRPVPGLRKSGIPAAEKSYSQNVILILYCHAAAIIIMLQPNSVA